MGNKFNLISNYLKSRRDLDLLFITESWLHSKHLDSMFCPAGYNCLRCDRQDKRGGGVIVFYKNELSVHQVDLNSSTIGFGYEIICIDLYVCNSTMRFFCVYLPPLSTVTPTCPPTDSIPAKSAQPVDMVSKLCYTIEPFLRHDLPVFIVGDFNLPHIDWSIPSCTKNAPPSHQKFLDFCSLYSLTQCIDCSTHLKGNILDIMLCNHNAKNILLDNCVTAPPFNTDHFLIQATVSCDRKTSTNPDPLQTSYLDFKSGNYELISQVLLHSNWDFCSASGVDLQDIYDKFISILHQIIAEHIPLKSKKHHNFQPKKIRSLLRHKKTLYRRYKVDKSLKSAYKQASKEYDQEVNKWHDNFESKLCMNPNSKKFYNFVNKKLKSSHIIPPLKNDQDSLIFSDLGKANIFNSSFQKFFTRDNGSDFPEAPAQHHMPPFKILPSDVLRAGLKMKKKLSRTPEEIPSYFIARNISALLKPITAIFNICLLSNSVPNQWKSAFVIPVYKKGSRSDASNYRPVSLTSSLSRLFEAVILDKMMEHVQQYDLITPHQFGFLPHKSSCSQLLMCTHKWLRSYCESDVMNVLYTDFSKAFDSVNHRFLIKVLNQFGFNTQVINWLKNFLSGRMQQVCIGSSVSDPLDVLSGVPQGSVIGPFLFILFINSITDCLASENVGISMYADDSKFFSNSPNDLQISINLLKDWVERYQLKLAPHKCFILKTKKKTVHDGSQFWIGDHPVDECPAVKDLGIYVSQDMDWSIHINHICHNASVKSYQLLKSIRSKNLWTLTKLFTTYVRPLLEYNSPVWSPHLEGDITSVERIQRHYTKKIFERCNVPFSSYNDRLMKLNLLTLQNRRKLLDQILIYKLVNNIHDLQFHNFFSFNNSPYFLRSHPLQIAVNSDYKINNWTKSFFVRAPTLWNKLPQNIVTADSVNNFKSMLRRHLMLNQ